MAWLQLSLDLEGLDPARVELHCRDLGALSITLSDAADDPVLEPPPGTTPAWPHTRLSALFAGQFDGQKLRSELAAILAIACSRIEIDELEDRNWSEAWREGFRPMKFGSRLWICQAGQRPDEPGAMIIDLDPGLAFGTGTHPTTALCIEWLCRVPLANKSVLDFGCGSGILALSAARLGAQRVLATDIDPQALQATAENAARNNLADVINTCQPADIDWLETDILVANILANPLRKLAHRFAGLVRPGGAVALAGILEPQAASLESAFAADFELVRAGLRDGWVLLAGRRRKQP